MPNRVPVAVDAEYRGVAAASEFTARDTGERIQVPAKLKFEYDTAEGDVEMLVVSASQFDKAQGAPDFNALKRGDRMVLVGLVVLQDRGSDRDSYFKLDRVEKAPGVSKTS
ncbi:MAG TPA: hypothetical protein VFW38_01960 [Solirubrobacteraceae bacterium]|nr:hypothetical protein [Solirubrobacteraceae bacterium]